MDDELPTPQLRNDLGRRGGRRRQQGQLPPVPACPAAPGASAGASADASASGSRSPGAATGALAGGQNAPPLLTSDGSLRMQKHLVFTDDAVEHAYRLDAAVRFRVSELALVTFEVLGWAIGTGRALHLGRWDIAARMMVYCLVPTLAQRVLLRRLPSLYQRHRQVLSPVLRVPYDYWLLFTDDVLLLGATSRRAMPRCTRLLLIAGIQLVLDPLFCCQLFLCTYIYSTLLLAAWMLRGETEPLTCWWARATFLGGLLCAYAAPLTILYWREAGDRTAFALRHVRGVDRVWLRSWVDAEGELGPAEFWLPGVMLAAMV